MESKNFVYPSHSYIQGRSWGSLSCKYIRIYKREYIHSRRKAGHSHPTIPCTGRASSCCSYCSTGWQEWRPGTKPHWRTWSISASHSPWRLHVLARWLSKPYRNIHTCDITWPLIHIHTHTYTYNTIWHILVYRTHRDSVSIPSHGKSEWRHICPAAIAPHYSLPTPPRQ